MKENSKKVPDAPLKLFVKPEHAGFTSEWIDKEGNQHEGYNVWLGVADERAWGYDEYINLAKVWHQGKELPKRYDDCLIDFGDSSYDVGHITKNRMDFMDGVLIGDFIHSNKLFNGHTSKILFLPN